MRKSLDITEEQSANEAVIISDCQGCFLSTVFYPSRGENKHAMYSLVKGCPGYDLG